MWLDWFIALPMPILGVAVSTIGMYAAVLLFARWAGVRSFAEMSAFDVAVTIAIGSMIATTVASKDPPLLQGVVALATLYLLQLTLSHARRLSERLRRTVDNGPILVMGPGGTLLHENMRVARVTEDDLRCQLRKVNVIDPRQVQAVVVEGTGSVHVLHGHEQRLSTDDWILQNVRDYTGSQLREKTTDSSQQRT